MKSMKKTIAALVAISLVFGCVIGGSLAWLIAKADTVTNTFTTSDVGVTLTETTGANYEMVPGMTIAKNPKASVTSGSEDAYLFVKLEKANGVVTYKVGETDTTTAWNDFLSYEIADGWTLVPGQTDVYYRTVTKAATEREFSVLKGDKVAVKTTVTKAMMNAVANENTDGDTTNGSPELKITAYAHQLYKANNGGTSGTDKVEFTVAEAWANASTANYNTSGANTTNGN